VERQLVEEAKWLARAAPSEQNAPTAGRRVLLPKNRLPLLRSHTDSLASGRTVVAASLEAVSLSEPSFPLDSSRESGAPRRVVSNQKWPLNRISVPKCGLMWRYIPLESAKAGQGQNRAKLVGPAIAA